MADSAGLQQLIAEVFEAAFDPPLWERFFSSLCRTTGSTSIVITTSNTSCDKLSRPHLYNLSPAAWDIYAAGMQTSCPRLRYMRQVKPENVFHDRCHSNQEIIKNSKYYEELEQHWGTRYYMAKLLPISDYAIVHFSLHRNALDGHFQTREIELLEILSPHLVRALQMNNKLVMENCLDLSSGINQQGKNAVNMVDSNGVPIYITPSASNIIGDTDAIRIETGTLTTRYRSDQAKLDGLISSAIRKTIANRQSFSKVMPLHKNAGGRPYKVQVNSISPLNRFCPLLDAAATVVLTDPEKYSLPDIRYLSQLYNLTPTESRFARAFIECSSLPETTIQLGISKNTARAHLQNVFRKTGTTSQAELLKLVMSS